MKPIIVEKDKIILAGMSFFGDPFASNSGWTEENEIGRLWNRFMPWFYKNAGRIKYINPPDVMYELHLEHPETDQKGEYEIFIGVGVERLFDIPVELQVKILPATTYAVFTVKGTDITSDWHHDFNQNWLKKSQYKFSHRFAIQHYDKRFKGLDKLDESEIDIYMPIKREKN